MNERELAELRARLKKLKPVKEARIFEEPGLLKAFTPRPVPKAGPGVREEKGRSEAFTPCPIATVESSQKKPTNPLKLTRAEHLKLLAHMKKRLALKAKQAAQAKTTST